MDASIYVQENVAENVTAISGTNEGFVALEPADFCYMDSETAKTLELVQNNIDESNRRHSLFGYLNSFTSTTTGARLTREGILRPLCHLPTLEHRLDCIEYLVSRVDVLGTISASIRKFGCNVDLENVGPTLASLFKSRNSTLGLAERRLDAIATVETLVSQIVSIIAVLQGADQPMLNIYKVSLQDPVYDEILEDILSVIEPDVATVRGKRGKIFKIKQGVESLFDIARSTYITAINDLEQYVRDLQREDNIPWKLNYSETRGYFLQLTLDPNVKTVNLGPKYIRVVKSRTILTASTADLMRSNVRANVSYENSMKLANEILTRLISQLMDNISAILKLVDIVGMIDLITSFAKLVNASEGKLVRPRFTATDTVIIKSRHPILESILNMNNVNIIPNDVVMNSYHNNFMLITGPNMGGKSIYLKQVALIQIMAQLGCYVPADSAQIKLFNRIVARTGSGDDHKANCSSFMWEMKNVASALREDDGSNQSVLYLIDEVGRGTSIDDGASYSFAIAEELAMKRNCFTIFATHFDRVHALTSLYGNVMPYRFRYEPDPETLKLKLTHTLTPGIAENDHYGIRLAQSCGFPEDIIQMARKDLELEV